MSLYWFELSLVVIVLSSSIGGLALKDLRALVVTLACAAILLVLLIAGAHR